MRIAVNTRFLLPNRLEGIGWFSYEVIRRLVKKYPEHEFIFFFDRPYDKQFIFGPNVNPVVLFPPARHATLWYWWFEWSLHRALKRYKADVFLSPDGFLSLRSKVKTVMVTHDIAHMHFPEQIPYHGRVFYKYFVPKYLQQADQIITVSSFTKEDILHHYSIEAEKIAVACNGCREEFQPLSEAQKVNVKAQYAEGEEYFFYLGAVHPRKNVHRLISAFDIFKQRTHSRLKLLIGGRLAWQTGLVKSAYEQAKYKSDILLLGYVEEKALPLLMGAAHALTYLSVFEGFGVPLLEAMHCEVPILASNVTSIPEVVGEAGLLVDPENIETIAQAMEKMDQNKPLREALIAKGRIQREQFSWDKATAVIYNALINL